MICPKCNQMVPDGSKFCQSCGANLMEASIDDVAGVEKSVVDIVDPPKPAAETPEPVVETPELETEEKAAEPTPDVSQAEVAAEAAMSGASMQSEHVSPETAAAGQQTYASAGQQTYAGSGQQMATVGATVVKKGLSKPVLFGIVGGGIFLVAAAITLLIVFLVVGKKTTYNLNDYTDVTFEGTDGSGTAKAELNEKLGIKLAEDNGMGDLVGHNTNNGADLADLLTYASANLEDIMNIYNAVSSIKLHLDKEENLKNGDSVTVTYTVDVEKAKAAKAEFIAEPMTVTVSGLDEIKEVDPFEDLQLSFEGTAPNAYASYSYKSTEEWSGLIYFELDKTDGLKEGDNIVVRLEGYDENTFAERYGVKFSQTEKTYPVENVDAFLTENKDLEPAALDIMKSATEGYVKEYFEEGSRKDAIKASDIHYAGYYFLTNKKSDVWYGLNKVYLIYSATVTSKEKKKQFKPKTVYFPVEYDDIKRLADGSYEIETQYRRILGSTDLKFGYWQVVSGYTDTDTMYSELIEADSAEYDGAIYTE